MTLRYFFNAYGKSSCVMMLLVLLITGNVSGIFQNIYIDQGSVTYIRCYLSS